MFEYIYSHFDVPGYFRLFGYVSFRALLAGLSAMLVSFVIGDPMIRFLKRLRFGETIREDGPESHHKKTGTPTMGGLMILISLLVSCLLFGNLTNPHFGALLVCTLLFGMIGFMDDYSKVVLRHKNGMNARMKMLLTLLVAFAFCFAYYQVTPDYTPTEGKGIAYNTTGLFIPFYKKQLVDLGIPLAFVFWMLVIVGSSHAVNLTDGLDGLAIGNVSIVALTMGGLAYITGTPRAAHYLNLPTVTHIHETAVFLAALTGAGVGFLWFNCAPARVFMGDTGSLALGAALGMSAIMIKKEFLLLISGGVFVMEAVSVILQVGSYKLRRKRIFRMAPIHHHFELSGWPETRVVIRFWLIGIILSLLALSTLRIQ